MHLCSVAVGTGSRHGESLVYRAGIENEKIDRNPLSRVRRKQEANDRVRYLTLEEENRLVLAIEAKFPSYVSILRLSVTSGMRQSEQFRSQAGDFDPGTKMLTVHQKKDRSKPRIRHTPLDKVRAAPYAQLAKDKKRGARLCMNTEGSAMTDVDYWFKPMLAAAGISDYPRHGNRHTACSRGYSFRTEEKNGCSVSIGVRRASGIATSTPIAIGSFE